MFATSPTATHSVPFTARLVARSTAWKVLEQPWSRRPPDTLYAYEGTYCDGAVTVGREQIGFFPKKPGLTVSLHRPVEEAALRGVFASIAEGMRIDFRPYPFAKSIHVYLAGDDFREKTDIPQRSKLESAARGLGLGDCKIFPHPENPDGVTSRFFSNVEYTMDIAERDVSTPDARAAAAVAKWASKFPDHAVPPRVRFRVLDDAGQDVTNRHFDALSALSTEVAGDPALRRGGMPLRVLGGVAGLGITGVAAWFGYEAWGLSHPSEWLAKWFLTACSALGVVVGGALVVDALRPRAPESSTVKFDPPA